MGYKRQASLRICFEITRFAVDVSFDTSETIKQLMKTVFKYDLIWGAGGTVKLYFQLRQKNSRELVKQRLEMLNSSDIMVTDELITAAENLIDNVEN